MREIVGIAVLVGCAQPMEPDKPIVAVTPSDQRATSDITPQFFAVGSGDELNLDIELFDRLEQDQDPFPTIELAANEHLYAVVGQTRVRLLGELFPVPGFGGEYLWERYTATIPAAPEVVIEFARADGSLVTSTIDVPAPFAIASPPPANITMGDDVTFSIAPAPGDQMWAGSWNAWCDATPDQEIPNGGYDWVEVSADGWATAQLGIADYGYATDCAAQLQVMLYAYGHYDPAFATTYVPPFGRQQAQVGVHLWGI